MRKRRCRLIQAFEHLRRDGGIPVAGQGGYQKKNRKEPDHGKGNSINRDLAPAAGFKCQAVLLWTNLDALHAADTLRKASTEDGLLMKMSDRS